MRGARAEPGIVGQRALYVEHAAAAMRRRCRAAARSVRRFLPEIVEPIHRPDLDLVDVDSLQQAQRNFATRRAARPQLAIEVGLRTHALATDGQDDVALLYTGDDRPVPRATRGRRRAGPAPRRQRRPATGAPARRGDPVLIRSARIGFSASIGTNMLPGRCGSAVGRVAQDQRADAEQRAVGADQRRAAPVQCRRRGEDRRIEQVFPAARKTAAERRRRRGSLRCVRRC